MPRTTYQDELDAPEWQAKRQAILSRDQHRCKHCENKRYLTDAKNLYLARIKKKIDDPSAEYIKVNGQILLLKNHPPLKRAITRLRQTIHRDISYTFLVLRDHEPQAVRAVLDINILDKDFHSVLGRFNHIWDGSSSHNPMSDEIEEEETERPPKNVTEEFIDTIWKWNRQRVIKLSWLYGWNMHIHHTYYQQGRKAWEYPDEALLTLCYQCHHELHEQLQVPVRDVAGQLTGQYLTPCIRCCGEGWLEEYNYYHQGICFDCRGARYVELIRRS